MLGQMSTPLIIGDSFFDSLEVDREVIGCGKAYLPFEVGVDFP